MQIHEQNINPRKKSKVDRVSSSPVPDQLADWLKLSEEVVIMILFSAEWMGSTFMFTDALQDCANEHERVQFFTADVERDNDLALQLGVNQVPTTLIFHKHEVAQMLVGTVSRHKIERALAPMLENLA